MTNPTPPPTTAPTTDMPCCGTCDHALSASAGTPHQAMLLSALHPGQSARICAIRAQGELGRRLRDMGLLPGVSLSVTRRAPLGDPIAVSMDDCVLSLRCAEAAQIVVENA